MRKTALCAALYHNQHEHQAATLWLKFPQNKERRPCCHDIVHHGGPDKVRSLCKPWFLVSGETAVEIGQGVEAGFIDK